MKTWTVRKGKTSRNLVLVTLALCLAIPSLAWAQGPPRISLDTTSPQKVSLTVGKSVILGTSEPVKRVSLGTPDGIPEIAVALVLTPYQIYLTGKNPGVTNLTIWGKSEKIAGVLDIEVSPDVSRLQEMLRKIVPEEKDIRVTATNDNITLSGKLSDPSNLDQVLAIAEPYFPKKVINLLKVEGPPMTPELARAQEMFLGVKESIFKILPEEKGVQIIPAADSIVLSGTVSSSSNLSQVTALAEAYYPKKVVNLLEVGGVHQVMLEVRVAEMTRTLLKRLGLNFAYLPNSGPGFGVSMINNLTNIALSDPARGFTTSFTNKIQSIIRFAGANAQWTFFIDALKDEGLLKVLAEPTLIAVSGKSANFLAGGEFPIPVPQPSGLTNIVTIQYKPFGVGLNFAPMVLSNKKISMRVEPEVSDLDFTNAIQISGFVVPAITTRRASTTIELADGQSFAIAGLLRDQIREDVAKFPILGDIPILGALFRSTSFQKSETELVIIVTAHLVKPLDMAKQTLPTDQYIEPDDFEFYLLGKLEGQGKPGDSRATSSPSDPKKGVRMEGDFGHAIPK